MSQAMCQQVKMPQGVPSIQIADVHTRDINGIHRIARGVAKHLSFNMEPRASASSSACFCVDHEEIGMVDVDVRGAPRVQNST